MILDKRDIFDNFYYNLRNVKSLKIWDDEYFVDYPNIFMEKYGVSFPEYRDSLPGNYTGFCVMKRKLNDHSANLYDDFYFYLNKGNVKFFQKSNSICDRVQYFYDDNFYVRKDFFDDEYKFMPSEYFDLELSEDPYYKILNNKRLSELKKSYEARRGNFKYKYLDGGLDCWDDNVSFSLSSSSNESNLAVMNFNYKDDKDVIDYLEENIDSFSSLEKMRFLFGPLPTEVISYDSEGKSYSNFVSFYDALSFLRGE